MKLSEIFDTTEKERHANFSKVNRQSFKNAGDQKSGSFGIVRDKKSDPFLVSKNTQLPLEHLQDDPYYVYIKYIVDNKIAQENPYAPRVYNITLLRDEDEGVKYKIDMEKLFEMNDLEEGELQHIITTAFEIPKQYEDDIISVTSVTEYVKQGIIYGRHIRDENFSNIAEIIRKIKYKKNSFEYDIRSANLMVRRSPSGTQLVIIDPLYSETLI